MRTIKPRPPSGAKSIHVEETGCRTLVIAQRGGVGWAARVLGGLAMQSFTFRAGLRQSQRFAILSPHLPYLTFLDS